MFLIHILAFFEGAGELLFQLFLNVLFISELEKEGKINSSFSFFLKFMELLIFYVSVVEYCLLFVKPFTEG